MKRYDVAALAATVYDAWRAHMPPMLRQARAARAALLDGESLGRAWVQCPGCGRTYYACDLRYAHTGVPGYNPCYHQTFREFHDDPLPATLRPPVTLPLPPKPEGMALYAAGILGRAERMIQDDGLTAGELTRVARAAAKDAGAAGRWIGVQLPTRDLAARAAADIEADGVRCLLCEGRRYDATEWRVWWCPKCGDLQHTWQLRQAASLVDCLVDPTLRLPSALRAILPANTVRALKR